MTMNEGFDHTHPCTPLQVASVTSKADLVVKLDLLPLVRLVVEAKTPTTNICVIVSQRIGQPFSAQNLANCKRDKLKIDEPLANLRSLLARYQSFDGYEVVLIKDENKKVCAVAFQSAMQRSMFERFGDNLLLDFTYNTNNHRYNLSALLVTSPTGSGVSVCNFLCVNQTKEERIQSQSSSTRTTPSGRC